MSTYCLTPLTLHIALEIVDLPQLSQLIFCYETHSYLFDQFWRQGSLTKPMYSYFDLKGYNWYITRSIYNLLFMRYLSALQWGLPSESNSAYNYFQSTNFFWTPQTRMINLRASSVFLNKVFLLTVNEHYWVQSNLLFMSYLSGVSGIRVEQTAPRIQVRATAIQPGAEQYIHLDSMYTLRTSTCCLLCWTGLNQFMGCLGRATCTIHSISAQIIYRSTR